jgi:hypothetical protein
MSGLQAQLAAGWFFVKVLMVWVGFKTGSGTETSALAIPVKNTGDECPGCLYCALAMYSCVALTP